LLEIILCGTRGTLSFGRKSLWLIGLRVTQGVEPLYPYGSRTYNFCPYFKVSKYG